MNVYACPKKFYLTKEHAEQVLSCCQSRGRGERKAYLCPKCGAWHLTSMPGSAATSATRERRKRKRALDPEWVAQQWAILARTSLSVQAKSRRGGAPAPKGTNYHHTPEATA